MRKGFCSACYQLAIIFSGCYQLAKNSVDALCLHADISFSIGKTVFHISPLEKICDVLYFLNPLFMKDLFMEFMKTKLVLYEF